MQMDSAAYMLESSVMMAPLERRICDFYDPRRVGVVVVPSATSNYPTYGFESKIVSSHSSSVNNIIDFGSSKNIVGLNADVFGAEIVSGLWIENKLVDIKVQPLAGELIAAIEEQLDSIYALDAAALIDTEQSRVSIRAVVDVVEDYIKAKDLWSLNEFLAVANPTMLRKITNVSILRTSFRMREKLSNWAGLYERVYAHLTETDQDPERALRGLSRPKVVKIA
ncbi:hypothetical protein GIW54_05385 [Pseudomonas proteolytica]|uniref:Uncharacterized protein n=1 Tax=Pseudomonas proteolytica TaxID=219574 RepID=A0AAW5A007_9PSED|nr:hypothetical protein [Pseudomonas proteolytica]MCF5056873.1 hypothetical protein [Pseudomonas proteolytica]MCF5100194.1 hypothetical protein [Pseudomonas proteolytica]